MPYRKECDHVDFAGLAVNLQQMLPLLQARRALDGHKLGLVDIAFRLVEDGSIAEVRSA